MDWLLIFSTVWPHFGHPDNVELCLDKILKNMGLDYIDLFLAHWPCVRKPASREALEKATSSHDATPTTRGLLQTDQGKPAIDWEHCTTTVSYTHLTLPTKRIV